MPRMPTFEEIRDDFERGIRTVEQAVEHPFQRHPDAPAQGANPYTQAPAAVPATMTVATAAAPQQEDTMSLATLEADLGQRVASAEAAIHNEIGKLIADLPGLTAEAKQLAANPFAQVAIKAAEHAASGILPLNAIATVAGHALQELNDLAALYGPPQNATDPAPAGQQPVVQGAPAQ